MSIDAVPAVGVHDEVASATQATPVAPTASTPFSDRIADGLQEVNRQLLTSQRDLQQLAAGEVENLHEMLIRLEESRTGLQLLLQVRNRVLEAYQDVMRMQV
ncbi:MAG: flagellar hook-basal body complex protein FliE [Comamonadaceae bacterium]|nr:MAG: flagellar hook-basal body complex protein FliE [Comamonadaceae bacterium]